MPIIPSSTGINLEVVDLFDVRVNDDPKSSKKPITGGSLRSLTCDLGQAFSMGKNSSLT
jgi:hypothetical protein